MTATGAEMVACLHSGRAPAGRWLLLAAHPDDEVLAASMALRLVSDLVLAHASDGATPGDGDAGLSDRRFAELDAALAVLGSAPTRRRYDLPDGGLTAAIGDLTDRLVGDLADIDVVVTHAFEGGHPDHDACAVAVQLACERMAGAGSPVPLRLQFAVYSRTADGIHLLAFGDDPQQGHRLPLPAPEQERKRQALAAFASQQHIVERFPLDAEALRPTSGVNWRTPRPPGTLIWTTDSADEAQWRADAVAAAGT